MKNNKLDYISFHTSNIHRIIKGLALDRKKIYFLLPIYYFITLINVIIEGVSMLLLVAIISQISAGFNLNIIELPNSIIKIMNVLKLKDTLENSIYFLTVLFSLNLVTRSALLIFDGLLNAKLRQKLQETLFRRFLLGQWSMNRGFRLGDAVGTNTQEAITVSKYLSSAIMAFYFLLSSLVMILMAIFTSPKIMVCLIFIGLPFVIIMKNVFFIQGRLSKKSALLRNQFSADIVDRFNGLLQVHVENNYEYHIKRGLRSQKTLTKLDILIGFCQVIIGSFNILLPLFVMTIFSLWVYFMGLENINGLSAIGGVGILSFRAASLFNGAVASFGNLSRLSGSLEPVLKALNIEPILKRIQIKEKIKRVYLNHVSFSYGDFKVVNDVDLKIIKGEPLIIKGRSGRGKTTLVNLIAGLYLPKDGYIIYQGISGKKYLSNKYFARIGFVIQDIYLFEGTIRENLVAGKNFTDDKIWKVLDDVDASDFVKNIGGLEAKSSEAGRSFSGGQRRRLGIARALLSRGDILIFDEVTAGLDKANKIAIIKLIERLSKNYLVIVISHTPLKIDRHKYFYL